jgi:TPR repeat protein
MTPRFLTSTASAALRWALALSAIWALCAGSHAAETDLSSDELMRRIIALGSDKDLKADSDKQRQFQYYLQELMDRAKSGQPAAMFNYGWYRYQTCVFAKRQGVDVVSAPMCTQAREDLKAVAENTKISILYIAPAAMSFLGEMHRDGIGTRPSRYLAADWFVQSAKQRIRNGDREGAIRAMEDALTAVSDHTAALELRAALLK